MLPPRRPVVGRYAYEPPTSSGPNKRGRSGLARQDRREDHGRGGRGHLPPRTATAVAGRQGKESVAFRDVGRVVPDMGSQRAGWWQRACPVRSWAPIRGLAVRSERRLGPSLGRSDRIGSRRGPGSPGSCVHRAVPVRWRRAVTRSGRRTGTAGTRLPGRALGRPRLRRLGDVVVAVRPCIETQSIGGPILGWTR